jgi:hypothetical protein
MPDPNFELVFGPAADYDTPADPEDRATPAGDPRAGARGYTVVLARNRSGPLSSLRTTGIPNPINASFVGRKTPTQEKAKISRPVCHMSLSFLHHPDRLFIRENPR